MTNGILIDPIENRKIIVMQFIIIDKLLLIETSNRRMNLLKKIKLAHERSSMVAATVKCNAFSAA